MTETTLQPDNLPMVPSEDLGDVGSPYPPEPLSVTLDRIVQHNKRFIHHADESSHWLTALWVASTHGMNEWDWHGRLYITAPDRGVGKSTAAEVMASLCPNADPTGSTSGPGLFRNISANQPTLFLDEAESQFSSNAGRDGDVVNQVINSGYKHGARSEVFGDEYLCSGGFNVTPSTVKMTAVLLAHIITVSGDFYVFDKFSEYDDLGEMLAESYEFAADGSIVPEDYSMGT